MGSFVSNPRKSLTILFEKTPLYNIHRKCYATVKTVKC